MHAQRTSIPPSSPWCRSALSFGVAFAVLLFAGCDRVTGPDDPAVGAVVVTPAEASIEVGATQQFSAALRDPNGSFLRSAAGNY
jgi:hypothetical protein